MIHKTRGIVLNFIKYKETSIITHIFTEHFGVQSYIVNSIRSAKSRQKISNFQSLSLLDLVVYKNEQKEINRISEYKLSYLATSILSNHHKSFIAIFLSEALNRILKEAPDPEHLFSFLYHSIIEFDGLSNQFENFHLQFLLKLSDYLGVSFEQSLKSDALYEDSLLTQSQKEVIANLSLKSYSENIILSNEERRLFLKQIINFYSHQLVNLKDLKSLSVLKEILA